jgi:hypothetical protein
MKSLDGPFISLSPLFAQSRDQKGPINVTSCGIDSIRIVIGSLDECKPLGEYQISGQRYSKTPMILLDRECLIQTIEKQERHLFGPEIRYEVRFPCLGSLD